MEKFTTIVENVREQLGIWFMPALASVTLLFIFLIAGGGVSQNDRWRVDTINVVGANTVSSDAIRDVVKEKIAGNYFFVYARENSYIYPRGEIEGTLLGKFPRLVGAHAVRIDAHTISLEVSERKPYALWCGENTSAMLELESCWFIDNNGFIFDKAPVFSTGVYMQVYGEIENKNTEDPVQGVLPYERFAMVNSLSQMIRADVGVPRSVILKDDSEAELVIHSSTKYPFMTGVVIRFNDTNNQDVLMKNLLASIPVQFPDNVTSKKKLLYIDMRFGNKIFFGFEN